MNCWQSKQARVRTLRRALAQWRRQLVRRVEATFQPRDVHTVRASARAWIGERLTWRASWSIGLDDNAEYAGQEAWLPEPVHPGAGRGYLGWVPACDLADPAPVRDA